MAASLLSKLMLPGVCPARESELDVHPIRGLIHRSFFSKLSFQGLLGTAADACWPALLAGLKINTLRSSSSLGAPDKTPNCPVVVLVRFNSMEAEGREAVRKRKEVALRSMRQKKGSADVSDWTTTHDLQGIYELQNAYDWVPQRAWLLVVVSWTADWRELLLLAAHDGSGGEGTCREAERISKNKAGKRFKKTTTMMQGNRCTTNPMGMMGWIGLCVGSLKLKTAVEVRTGKALGGGCARFVVSTSSFFYQVLLLLLLLLQQAMLKRR